MKTVPDEWLLSTFVTLAKKSNAQSCEDFRTINLLSYVLDIPQDNSCSYLQEM